MTTDSGLIKALEGIRSDIQQLSVEELIGLNGEVLTNYTFNEASKVRKLIQKHLPTEPVTIASAAVSTILLDVTTQKLMGYIIQPAPLEWKP